MSNRYPFLFCLLLSLAGRSARAEALDPCSLLRREEAAEILGGPVDPGLRSSFFNKDNCEFRRRGEPSRRIILALTKEPVSPETFRRNRQVLALGLEMAVPELAGIADAAYAAGRTLTLLKGTTVVEIDVTKVLGAGEAEERTNLEAAKVLASRIVGRIPLPSAARAI